MNDATKLATKLSTHPVVIYAATICTVVQLALWALEARQQIALTLSQSVIVHSSLAALIIALYGVTVLMRQNKAFKGSFESIHELNHLYRETLAGTTAKLLSVDSKDSSRQKAILFSAERETLRSVVRIVSAIFNKITNRDTTTTIWLYDNATKECSEYISCKENENALRKMHSRPTYDVDLNDVFSKCVGGRGKCCHYLGANLKKLRKKRQYNDQRIDNEAFYKSVLSVPIRYGHGDNENRIGYLQIDQKSANHLNDVEHLFILAACADQLYNFLSIIRRNFLFG